MPYKAKLIIADAEHILQYEKQILSQIAPQYVKKYQEHKIEADKKQELMAGYLLKIYLDIEREEQLVINENGKPLLKSGKPFFNLSHSGNYVVLVISDCEIGVDIEHIMQCHEATVKKVYSPRMQEELIGLSGEEKNEKFSRLWTEFEARLKLKGTGFGEGWKELRDMNCYIDTRRVEDYFISVVAEYPLNIEVEHFHLAGIIA